VQLLQDRTYVIAAEQSKDELEPWQLSRKYDVKSKIQFCQQCVIYMKNDCVKFQPDPFWNDGAYSSFEDGHSNKKNNNRKEGQQNE